MTPLAPGPSFPGPDRASVFQGDFAPSLSKHINSAASRVQRARLTPSHPNPPHLSPGRLKRGSNTLSGV